MGQKKVLQFFYSNKQATIDKLIMAGIIVLILYDWQQFLWLHSW